MKPRAPKAAYLRAERPARANPAIAPARDTDPYAGFDQIDGRHPLQTEVEGSHVPYHVRRRTGGRILFFNFDLAREMGLIPADHPDTLTPALTRRLRDTFGIVIINEHDLMTKRKFHKATIKPHPYMATRYLQLQHKNKRGYTSGDGRGIWNGTFQAREGAPVWDVSSSGTGATRLSPAAANEGKFFRTGDPKVCYGNGCAYIDDGVSTALASEVLHRRGISTERTLVVIEYDRRTAVNVRAARCLLRPAHFFHHLKQGQLERLRSAVELYAERMITNGEWPAHLRMAKPRARYEYLARRMAENFGEAAARFENEYVFCWLDWDGDNILADGGIIDYGSIRMFGLYFRRYRYDDVERWSTHIEGQRAKARLIAQTFAQASDYLITGRKRPLAAYKNHSALRHFDETYARRRDELALFKAGLAYEQARFVLDERRARVGDFLGAFRRLERALSPRGRYAIPDGENHDAIFNMSRFLREFPRLCARLEREEGGRGPTPDEMLETLRAETATKRDLRMTPARRRDLRALSRAYRALMTEVARKFRRGDLARACTDASTRAAMRWPEARMTGDATLKITELLLRNRSSLGPQALFRLIQALAAQQSGGALAWPLPEGEGQRVLDRALSLVREYAESV